MYLLILASISLESSLSTSSPKKKKTVGAAVINMPVLHALASLNADDSELTPVRHPVYIALQTLQSWTVTLKKLSTVTQVYPAVKAEPSSPVIDADTNIVPLSPGSPVTISSDSDEELPIVSELVVLLMLYQLPLAAMDANNNDEDEYEKVRGYQSNNMSDFVVDDDPFVENISSDVGSSVPAISSVTAGPLLIHTAD
ncbi:hypothetical protein C0989_009498, partial [Termitomyces sp. Mn162]